MNKKIKGIFLTAYAYISTWLHPKRLKMLFSSDHSKRNIFRWIYKLYFNTFITVLKRVFGIGYYREPKMRRTFFS
jgi:hypothetical protein